MGMTECSGLLENVVSDLSHLSCRVSSGSKVNHGQGRADAQRGDKDVSDGVFLTQSAEQLQGKVCVGVADGSHD